MPYRMMAAWLALVLALFNGLAYAQQTTSNIDDLVQLLGSYKPDLQRIERLRAAMNAPVPETVSPREGARLWHLKSLSADALQDAEHRTEFLERALEFARMNIERDAGEAGGYFRVRQDYAASLWKLKGIRASLTEFLAFLPEVEAASETLLGNGMVVSVYTHLATNYVHLGDLESAHLYLKKIEERQAQQKLKRNRNPVTLQVISEFAESTRGFLMQREGKLDLAERAYRAAIRQNENQMDGAEFGKANGARTQDRLLSRRDQERIYLANILGQQGRLNEAELMLREVLKDALVRDGLNSQVVGRSLWSLANVQLYRGRIKDAVTLAEWSERALREAGLSEQATTRINGHIVLANALSSAGQAAQAVAWFDKIRVSMADDESMEEGLGYGSPQSIVAYMQTGRLQDALRDADSLLRHHTRHFGPDYYATAEARAYRAIVLHRLGRTREAQESFEKSVSILLDPDKVIGRQQSSWSRTSRLRRILSDYVDLLAGAGSPGVAAQTQAFTLADVARWQSVQQAVAGSALRAAAGTGELANLIKRVQDADDEIQAVYKNLITQRSAPPDKQLPTVIKTMEARIATLQSEQAGDLANIRRQFPQYDALVNPHPADLPTAARSLRPNEALLSIFITPQGSYTWGVNAQGQSIYHFSNKPQAWLAERVARVRASVDLTQGLDPSRMRFDLQAASELYQEILAPVQQAWSQADTLMVVTNDVLGQIPFALLPTQPAAVPAADSDGLAQGQWRAVPWLARKVAISYIPSVSALVTLRALPPGRNGRDPFIGFGDPDFGARSQAAATRSVAKVRNLAVMATPATSPVAAPSQASASNPVAATKPAMEPVAQADEPVLNPLPDTRDEILAIANALHADVGKNTFFGVQASPAAVKQADLKRRRIVAFATHGLVAGDLPELDQPALALSPAGGRGIMDGMLKLDDILKLSLDADLVVLSACNTAAADGAGHEAVSGLGRAFFYAGARSVLATHWPVETVSARQLVTKLFEGYAADGKLTRAQALNRAMLDVMDKAVAADGSGRAMYAYAHPAFWAPYALYGDGGR